MSLSIVAGVQIFDRVDLAHDTVAIDEEQL